MIRLLIAWTLLALAVWAFAQGVLYLVEWLR